MDGQENPVTNIDSINLDEVQDYVSLSSHQLSSNLVIIGEIWNELSPEQQEALTSATAEAMVQEPQCAAADRGGDPRRSGVRAEPWRSSRTSIATPSARWSEPYLRENFSEEQMAVLEAIRSTAEE